jgi:hypothetical protein
MSDFVRCEAGAFDISRAEGALARLNQAILTEQSRARRLQLWSWFIRVRDGHRCVECASTKRLAAHHICRKSFLSDAQFQTGNGITLCSECHRQAHHGFNGRADLGLPMDAQGGEKLDLMERLYGVLLADAKERGIHRDDFYHLSDDVLARFKMFQGFDHWTTFPGGCLEQAYLIWRQCPKGMRDALLEANGLAPISDPLPPGTVLIELEE